MIGGDSIIKLLSIEYDIILGGFDSHETDVSLSLPLMFSFLEGLAPCQTTLVFEACFTPRHGPYMIMDDHSR